jgi:mannose-6-phosphate isomerase-like protein (cupin superfamily)
MSDGELQGFSGSCLTPGDVPAGRSPPGDNPEMDVQSVNRAAPFTTKDGSTIRELHHTERQSLAEATLEPSEATERHYHRASEEIYFVLKGSGTLEVDGELRRVRPGDAALIPPGAWHTLENDGSSELRILCCCAPPYSHDDTFFE